VRDAAEAEDEEEEPVSLAPRYELAFAGHYDADQQDVADAVAALVGPQQTVEQVDGGSTQPYRTRDGGWACLLPQRRRHVVEHGSLLEQLRAASHTTSAPGDQLPSDPRSKPAARIDAIAALQRVEVESLWWAQALRPRFRTRTRTDLVDRLRSLVGAARHSLGLEDDRGRSLAQASRSWVSLARVVTGHDSPPYAPHVRCPNETCERIGGLRIRLSDHVGVCLECGSSWEDDRLDRLGVWVRWATEHELGNRLHLVADDADVGVHRRPCPDCAAERTLYAERQRERRTAGKVASC
jgi:hypothetical protein